MSRDELLKTRLCHRTLVHNLPSILREGILPGGDKKAAARTRKVHLTMTHPSDPKAVYRGRDQATAVIELDMKRVASLLGEKLGANSDLFEFYKTAAECVLCDSGIPPCCIARISDAKSSMMMWRRPEKWRECNATLLPNHQKETSAGRPAAGSKDSAGRPAAGPQRPRLQATSFCRGCNTTHLEGTSICFNDDCRRPITEQGVYDWCSSFSHKDRTDRLNRLVEFGFNPKAFNFSAYATGKREGRPRKDRDNQIFTRNWCRSKHKQALKAKFRSWAQMVDQDPDTRKVHIEGFGFPRVLRHWNVDEQTGKMKAGPELIIHHLEEEYLKETGTEDDGVIDPVEAIKRPHISKVNAR
jgi:hypothetical protein